MEFKPLRLAGAYEIVMAPRHDDRGYFARTYDEEVFDSHGLNRPWVQENQSVSRRGVIRGLHFQRPPDGETKLVRVVVGSVYDVIVDLRRASESFGQWEAVELSAEARNMLYVPRGFAHGFCTLSDEAWVLYKVDAYHAPASEGGLRWNDASLGIPWPVSDPLISAKDRALPELRDLVSPF